MWCGVSVHCYTAAAPLRVRALRAALRRAVSRANYLMHFLRRSVGFDVQSGARFVEAHALGEAQAACTGRRAGRLLGNGRAATHGRLLVRFGERFGRYRRAGRHGLHYHTHERGNHLTD